jgi:Polyketide cyclase / dehydrase and lipid transport
MKIFRLLFFFLLALVATTALLSLLMATSQKIKRSITINAPAATIFEQVKQLNNFNRFSVWGAQDSTIRYTLSGTDGTPGASIAWKGNPDISGEGKIELISLTHPHTISHIIHFSAPQKGKASSVFSIIETEKNTTTVTWYFELYTPRPKNIFNLFFNLDKEMGKDFETGLAALKIFIESGRTAGEKTTP